MKDKRLHQKDPAWLEISNDFIQKKYSVFLPRGLDYYETLIQKNDFKVTTKDRATVVYAVVASAYGILENNGQAREKERNIFFQFLGEYVSLCRQGAKENGLREFGRDQCRILLKDCLKLLCFFESDNIREQCTQWVKSFISIDAPGFGYELALPVLAEQIFHERMQFECETYVQNTQALAEAYLDVSGPVAEKFRFGRAQVMNLLSDMAYFQGGEKGEQEAMEWARTCLEINPDDEFARMRRKFIEERLTVQLQIRRFNHDTGNTMAGINSRLDWLLKRPDVKNSPIETYLQRIRTELKRIHSINRFIRDKMPEREEFSPVELIRELANPFSGMASFVIVPDNTDLKWDTDPDYLGLAIDNLLRNSAEAFERRKIPVSERKIKITTDSENRRILVEDNAGGVEPALKDRMFEPYASSKPVKKETGLGLPNARSAAEKLKGKLVFPEDQPEHGARFEIYI